MIGFPCSLMHLKTFSAGTYRLHQVARGVHGIRKVKIPCPRTSLSEQRRLGSVQKPAKEGM